KTMSGARSRWRSAAHDQASVAISSPSVGAIDGALRASGSLTARWPASCRMSPGNLSLSSSTMSAPCRMSMPGRNVLSGSVPARTSMPMPRTNAAKRSVRGFTNMAPASGGFRQCGFGFGEGPIEPRRQRLDVARLHRGAAPDAQARRGIAIVGDVVGDAFLLHDAGERLGEGGLLILR